MKQQSINSFNFSFKKWKKKNNQRGEIWDSTWDLPRGPWVLIKSLYWSKVMGGYRGGLWVETSSCNGWIGISLLGL